MSKKELRRSQELWEQGLLPNGKYGYGHIDTTCPSNERRRIAIKNVLTTLPEEYFARFKEAMKDAAWFVPWKGLWGKAAEFPQKRVIIFLTPVLEFAEDWVIESLVVHEILHVILGHKLTDCTKAENDCQENEVTEVAAQLGYPDPTAELTKLFNTFKWCL